jgi:hypothetical protein
MIWDPPAYFEFHADHTISHFVVYPDGKEIRHVFGRWFAAGRNIYVVFPDEDRYWGRLIIWHIVDISDSELRIWIVRKSDVETYKRVHLHALSPEEQAIVGTWENHNIDSVSYMILEPNHTLATVSSEFGGNDLRLVGTGRWSVAGDDLAIELVSLLDDAAKSQPQKSTSRRKIPDFMKDRTRHAPVKYRMP